MIDYMVMEAVAIRVAKEDEKEQKEAEEAAERKSFKNDREHLKQFQ